MEETHPEQSLIAKLSSLKFTLAKALCSGNLESSYELEIYSKLTDVERDLGV